MMAYHLVAFSWLLGLHPLTWQGFSYNESLIVAALAWILPSIFHSCLVLPFTLLASGFYRTKHKLFSLQIAEILLLAFLWAAIQHKLSFNLGALSVLAVPVHMLAYSQHHYLALIQITNIIGAIGLEFLIVLVNLYFSNYFNVRMLSNTKNSSYSNYNINQPSFSLNNLSEQSYIGITLACLLSGALLYGSNCLGQKPPGKAVSFKIAQANLSAEDSRGKHLNASQIISIMKNKTAEICKPDTEMRSIEINAKSDSIKTNLILWPEGSTPILVENTLPEILHDLANYSDLFLFGAYHTENRKLFNSIGFVDFSQDELKLDFYNKVNLVPFGEYTPWLGLLPQSIKDLAKFAIGSGFDRGALNQAATKTSIATIGSSVCFELLFADLVRKQAEKSEILVNLNDLSWFGSKMIEEAFLAVARFRAIENAQSLILASNAGTSTGIDSCGRLSWTLNEGSVIKSKNRSIYNLYGW